MKNIIVLLIALFCVQSFAKDPSIRHIQIDGHDYSCRPSNVRVPCPINELRTLFMFSGNFADSIMCLNAAQGSKMSLLQDQEAAKDCFAGSRLKELSVDISRLMVNQECTSEFNSKCSEIYKCKVEDPVNGGYQLLCGHLGQYLDYLRRVKGLPEEIFTEQDGINICNPLF